MIRDWFAGLSRVPVTHIAWLDAGGVERARDIVTQRVLPGDGSLLIRQYLPSADERERAHADDDPGI